MVDKIIAKFRQWLVTLPPEAQAREREIGEENIARIKRFMGVK